MTFQSRVTVLESSDTINLVRQTYAEDCASEAEARAWLDRFLAGCPYETRHARVIAFDHERHTREVVYRRENQEAERVGQYCYVGEGVWVPQ